MDDVQRRTGLTPRQVKDVVSTLRKVVRQAGEIFAAAARGAAKERTSEQVFIELCNGGLRLRNRLALYLDRTVGKTLHRTQHSVPIWVTSNDEGTRLSTTPRGPSPRPSWSIEGSAAAA